MPSSPAGNLATEERLARLEEVLDAEGLIRIRAAAEALGVSEMTIRRDLQELEARGVARRTRGGAIASGPLRLDVRQRTKQRLKSRIARKLLELVPQTGSITIDSSSTMLRFANMLTERRDLSVLTNGIETFSALAGRPGVTPHIVGGVAQTRTGSLVGPLATRRLSEFRVDMALISSGGVDPDTGTTEPTIDEADVKRAACRRARRVVVAVDASKLGRKELARALDWNRIDVLVTELDPSDARLRPYRDLAELV